MAVPVLAFQRAAPDPRDDAPQILERIREPEFPKRDFDIGSFGSINEAIAACNSAGGGRVVVPAGVHTTGALRLKSRVNLYLSEGAVLKLRGYTNDPITDLRLVNFRFDNVEKPDILEHVRDVVFTNVSINGMVLNEKITP